MKMKIDEKDVPRWKKSVSKEYKIRGRHK